MKNALRRTLSIFLVLVMCISLVPASAWADEAEEKYGPTETVEQLSQEQTEETQEVEPTIEEETEPVFIPVESITITAEKTELEVDETLQLTATVLPEDATNKEVTWSSSDENVLTVDECGLITALSEGTAEVTAMPNDETLVFASIVIMVKDNASDSMPEEQLIGASTDSVTISLSGDNILTSENFPDANFLAELHSLYPDGLTASQAAAVVGLSVLSLNISSLQGIEFFTGLIALDCQNNKLSSLNISNCTQLQTLCCLYNNLSSLDVSANTQLKTLVCDENNLSSLNISKNTQLTKLECGHNSLKSLDVSKNTQLTELEFVSNNIGKLDLCNNTNLQYLFCSDNNLDDLDISGCTQLQVLQCGNNNLSSLDVSKNTQLIYLECASNNLRELDLSNSTQMWNLSCSDNILDDLDLSSCTQLQALNCSCNNLSSLDVSKNIQLINLVCSENNLSSLDVSNNTQIQTLFCQLNSLSVLNLNNSVLLDDCLLSPQNVCLVLPGTTIDMKSIVGEENITNIKNVTGGTYNSSTGLLTINSGIAKAQYSYATGSSHDDMMSVSFNIRYGYAVEFDANGGEGAMTSQVFAIGQSQTLNPNQFMRFGYVFTGWKLGSKTYKDGQTVKNLTSKAGTTVTLKAQWKAETFKIAFDPNGGTGSIKPVTVTYDKASSKLPSSGLKKTGWILKGWSLNPHDDEVEYSFDYQCGAALTAAQVNELYSNRDADNTVTLYAVWGPVEYKITYKNLPTYAKGSVEVLDNSMNSAQFCIQAIPELTAPTVPGYTFGGWFTDSKCTKPVTEAFWTGAAKTLYAKVTPVNYTISYDLQGGAAPAKGNKTSYNIKTSVTLNNPTRYGYTFAGWYFGETKVTKLASNTYYGGDIELTARWTPNSYTLVLNGNGGKVPGQTKFTGLNTDSEVELPSLADRDVYRFEGWSTKNDGTGDLYNPGQTNVAAAKNKSTVTLYAVWSYELAFNANGGDGTMGSQKMFLNRSAAINRGSYTKTGYYIAGWNTDHSKAQKGTVQYKDGASVKNLAGKTLYAVWKPITYKVVFHINNGTEKTKMQTLTYDKKTALTANGFTWKGHTFICWTADEGKVYQNKEKVVNLSSENNGTVDMYARWDEPVTYNIAFLADQETDEFTADYTEELSSYFEGLESKSIKYNLVVADAKNNATIQNNQVNNFIRLGYDAIILNPVNPTGIGTVVKASADAGIPMVIVNREPEAETVTQYPNVCYVGSDPRQAGTAQGEIILDLPNDGDLNWDGKISYIMIEGDPESTDAQYRTAYSVKALTDAGYDVECLDAQVGNGDQSRGQEICADALEEYGDSIEVIFCNDDAMAIGAAKAIQAAGRTVGEDVYLVGCDAIPQAVTLVSKGQMTGTVWNDYVTQARNAAYAAVNAINRREISDYYKIDYKKITVSNADELLKDPMLGPYHFEMLVKSFQSSYWQAAVKGIEMEAEAKGVTVNCQGPNAEYDIADQVNMLNSAISTAPDGIGLAPNDPYSVLDALQAAKDAGIPVVVFDSGVPNAPKGSVVSTVSTDNYAAGATAAEHLYDAVKDKIAAAAAPVRVGEVNQEAVSESITSRGLGFIDKFAELAAADGKTVAVVGNEFYVNNTKASVVAEAYADIIIEVAVPAWTAVQPCATEASVIMNKADLVCIFGSNQVAAEGILLANQNLKILGSNPATSVLAAGFDAGSVIKAAVKDGTMFGAVTQSPLAMGITTVDVLIDACDGKKVRDVPVNGYWYDFRNINSNEIAPNLYD